MQMHALGKTGLSIAPIVFGGNVFGWTVDEQTSFNILDAFLDAGFNAVDTADVYSARVPGNKRQVCTDRACLVDAKEGRDGSGRQRSQPLPT
jgi:predicted aldo/keto reductase-like oxidoreductase